MKIENSPKSLGNLLPTGEGRSRPGRETVSGSSTSPGTEVGLSSLSSTLQQAESAAAQAPAVDAQRVAEIRQAIADGQYKVDVGRIADGLIADTRAFLSAQSASTGKA